MRSKLLDTQSPGMRMLARPGGVALMLWHRLIQHLRPGPRRAARSGAQTAAPQRRSALVLAACFGLLAGGPALASGPVVGWGAGRVPSLTASAIAAAPA